MPFFPIPSPVTHVPRITCPQDQPSNSPKMTSASYRLDSFRPWNPFHDKPEALNMPAKLCRYPSPISMTASPTPSSYYDAPKAQSYADKTQRHPLPARPPEEVCLNAGTKSRSQSTLSDFGTSQQTITVEHGPPTSYPEKPSKPQKSKIPPRTSIPQF